MATKATRPKSGKGKKSGAGPTERYQKALESFDRALKALYKGDAAKAKEQLEKIQETYPEETELLDRVRSYLLVCERQMAPQRRPKTAEEYVNAGIVTLNDGDAAQALKHLAKAAELEPKNAHVQYCLAAAYAVSGDAAESAKHLKIAIGTDPSAKVHAKADEDFAAVRNSSEVAPLLAG